MAEIEGITLPEKLEETVETLRRKLITAVDKGNLTLVKSILETGITPNFQFPDVASPINYAAARHSYEILELLIRHGANPNFTTSGPVTTLGQACQTGYLNMVQLLLDWGARVDGGGAPVPELSDPARRGPGDGDALPGLRRLAASSRALRAHGDPGLEGQVTGLRRR